MKMDELCRRILEHCQRRHWYGGDNDDTAQFDDPDSRYERFYDAKGNEIVIDHNPDDHPHKSSFAYPPATEDQFAKTEQALGFSLPHLLKTLYTQLANGGFGPGHGFLGALEGFDEAGDLVDNYQFHRQRSYLVRLEDVALQGQEALELSETVWPERMLYLCDWDWAAASCIDCYTGRIYLKCPGKRNLYYRLELQAPSLAAWLER